MASYPPQNARGGVSEGHPTEDKKASDFAASSSAVVIFLVDLQVNVEPRDVAVTLVCKMLVVYNSNVRCSSSADQRYRDGCITLTFSVLFA